MVRTAVLVSGGGTNLQAIIDANILGEIKNCEIAAVISSNPNAYALKRAEYARIPGYIVDKSIFPNRESFTKAIVNKLNDLDIELVVLAGFMYVLSQQFTKDFKNRVINIHPALIPAFCGKGCYGLRVHEAALARGVKLTGATVHYVNEIPDGGQILLQKAVEILPGDTPEILQRRVMEQAEWVLLPQAAEMVAARLEKERS